MRKLFLFVVSNVALTFGSHARSAFLAPLYNGGFDSTQKTSTVTLIGDQKVCEFSAIHLAPNFSDSSANYVWTTPAGKKIEGVELNIQSALPADAGKYSLSIRIGETIQVLQTNIDVIKSPVASVSSLNDVCEGSVYHLSAQCKGEVLYEWTLPNGNKVNSNNYDVAKLSLQDAGTYQLTVTQNGCSSVKTFLLKVKPQPSVNTEGAKIVCEGSSIRIKTNADSGTVYTWWKGQNPVQRSAVFYIPKASYSNAGKYLLQANTGGCVNSAYFDIEVRPAFPVNITSVNEICEGDALKLAAEDAGSGAVYQWTGPKASFEGKDVFVSQTALTDAGKYTLNVTKNGCSLSTEKNINVRKKYKAQIIGNSQVCENSTLTLKAEGSGSYQWTLPDGSKKNTDNLEILSFSKSQEGTYRLRSLNEACSDSSFINVRMLAVPKLNLNADNNICEGVEMKLNANASAGTVVWKMANGEILSGSTLIKSKTAYNGYAVATATLEGCVAKDSLLLKIKSTPQLKAEAVIEACRFSPAFDLHTKEISGLKGRGFYSGEIVSGLGTVTTGKEGRFTAQYTFVAENGCYTSAATQIIIKKGIEVNAGADLTRKGDEPVQLSALVSDNFTKVEWTNIGGSQAHILKPLVTPTVTTTYKITVTNAAGCTGSDEVVVKVLKFNIPNAFSPNGDGVNDYFSFEFLKDYPTAKIQILSANGKLVFNGVGPQSKWDGRVNSVPADEGTYFYYIQLNDPKNPQPVQGWIQLKR